MPDPFAKVNPGDPIEFPAIAWNAMLDAARGSQFRTGGTSAPIPSRQATIVNVANGTGSDLNRNSVVGLEGPIFHPSDSQDAFLREVTFRAVIPDYGTHKRRYAVLLDPIPSNQVGRAHVAGVCQVLLDVVQTWHEYARVVDNDATKLESAPYGTAQILWTEAEGAYYGYDTGVMWAIVRLGATPSGVFTGKVTTAISTGTLASPSSDGRATLRINGDDADTDIVVWNDHTLSSSIGVDAVIKLAIIDDKYWLIAADC